MISLLCQPSGITPCWLRGGTRIRLWRKVVTGPLELKRAEKIIGSGLEAHITLKIANSKMMECFANIDFAEVTITSSAEVMYMAPTLDMTMTGPMGTFEGVQAHIDVVAKDLANKCARCWRVLEEVVHHPDTHLCNRCTDAVQALEPE